MKHIKIGSEDGSKVECKVDLCDGGDEHFCCVITDNFLDI
jgi:hypothetical protein